MLRVRLVGGLRLELDGLEIDAPRSRRARALLAWLAAHPGVHARSELAGRFWPDVLDESARASLRAALTELRTALRGGAGLVVASRETVGLTGDELWVDVREFERRLAAGELEAAVELGSGRLLAGLDDDWALAARDAHEARLAGAHERLARRAEQAGSHAAAAAHTRAALALDPLAEETARRLMRRLAAAGDRAAAVAAYDGLAERLRATLGIAPSPATRALAEEIRRGGEAAPGPPPAELPPPAALARVDETPFVGREREMERLRAAWAGVTTHATRRLVLVVGEPGIGKTHLMLRFARERESDAGAVLLGRCSEEPLSAYEPFSELLRHCAQALGAGFLAARAGQGGHELDRLLGRAQAEPEGDPGARHRLFDAVDAALCAVAGDRPLLLLLDDLHWADRPTLLLLGALLRSPRRAPLLAIATYRDRELQGGGAAAVALAELQRDRAVDRISMSGLSGGDVAQLARSWLGDEAAARVAGGVHARTGGNAYFVEEMLRGLADRDTDAVPDSVREAVAARAARLGEDAEALLMVAAVLGLEVELDILEAVSGLDPDVAEAALDELLAAYLLRPAADGGGQSVEFPHALVREAVDAACNPLRRRRLHRRAADVLASLSEERHLEAITHHLAEAAVPGESDRVARYLERAGARAERMLAYEEAARFYARAIEILASHGAPDGPRIGRLQVTRGEALLRAGDPGGADACFEAAASVARRTGDAELLACAALGRTGLGVAIIDLDPARIALLEEALEAVGEADDVLRSQLLARLAVELYYAPSRDRSEALSAEAVAVARAAADPRALAAALNARHVALWRPDRLRERLAAADEMLDAARAAGERHLELQARNWRVVDLFELGDFDAWRREVARHGSLADELRLPVFSWYTPLWHAVDALHRGSFAEADMLRNQALEAGRRAGDPNAELFSQLLVFQESWLRMDFSTVDLTAVEDKLTASPARVSWRCGYAWTLAELGRLDEARATLASIAADDFAALPFDANWPSAVAESAEACVLLGEVRWASVLYELIRPYEGRPLTAGRAICMYGSCSRQLGGLAALLGRHDDAVAHFEDAIRRDEAAGLRPWVVRSRLALARALRAAGEADRAAAVAAVAADEAAALGIAGRSGPA